MRSARIVILTGASGSGKTAIAEVIGKQDNSVDVLHFDSIGVPSPAAMIAGWGESSEPGGAWLRAMTLEWMAKLSDAKVQHRPLLFEGQMRPSSIKDALRRQGLRDAAVILVDCDDAIRTDRLERLRKQPALANRSMMNWAAFLRKEAEAEGYDILDTSSLSVDAAVACVHAVLYRTRSCRIGPAR